MALFTLLLPAVAAFILVIIIAKLTGFRKTNVNRDLPGPTSTLGLNIIGRIHDLPRKHIWLKVAEWGDEYGPIFKMYLWGQLHVFILSEHVAHDILSKRGHIYSDRFTIGNVPGTKTGAKYMPLIGHNEIWKRQRRFGHINLSKDHQSGYYDCLGGEALRLLVKLLNDTPNYGYWIDQFTGRVVCRLAYGYPDHSVPLKLNALAMLESISPAGRITNVLPQLMWLPFAINPWKKEEKLRQDKEAELYTAWQEQVRREMQESRALPSWTRTYLEGGKDQFGFDDKEASYAVGMMALAAIQTIASSVNTFLYAMVHHPQWLRAVQNEIDCVCGDQMPDLSDFPLLPTLRACLMEGLRWRPPVPTGVPHELMQDDVWNGYLFPKGTRFHALDWALSRDESNYPEPHVFKPERWLNPKYPTYKEPLTRFPNIINHHQFGYGRRVCQGRELVEAELLIACGAIAWGLDFTKEAGDMKTPHDKDYTSLLIVKPANFSFVAKPRSLARKDLIFASWESAKAEDPQLISKYDCWVGKELVHHRYALLSNSDRSISGCFLPRACTCKALLKPSE